MGGGRIVGGTRVQGSDGMGWRGSLGLLMAWWRESLREERVCRCWKQERTRLSQLSPLSPFLTVGHVPLNTLLM